jgi:hypothetical protein
MVGRTHKPWHAPAVVAFTAVCAWYVFHVRERPPGLTYFDIAVHEAGHVAFAPFGRLVMLAMGDGAQVLFPLGLALFQLLRQRDLLTGALLLGWAGEAAGDAANYIGDAPFSRYSLIGGPDGDWTAFFGPVHLNRMDLAVPVANVVRIVAVALMLTAVTIAIYCAVRDALGARARSAPKDSGDVSAEPSRTGSYRAPWQSEPPVGIRPRRSATAP